jgi:enoyl-CoA hydratase/carnithine racemase
VLAYEARGSVAWVTLDRSDKRNALPRSFWPELEHIVARVEDDPDVRVMVLMGAGPCFCSGGDIDGFGLLEDARDRRDYVGEALGALRRLDACAKPTIAAVHGQAFGGGCELTMVCDVVVADETARFATPESSVGLVPGLGVVRGLAHVNLHWMKFLVFTGESIDAQEARLAGLVNRVVPAGEHVAAAQALAERIARQEPLALAVGKRILHRRADEAYAHSQEAIAFLQGTRDAAEGIDAFRERRRPRFDGR